MRLVPIVYFQLVFEAVVDLASGLVELLLKYRNSGAS